MSDRVPFPNSGNSSLTKNLVGNLALRYEIIYTRKRDELDVKT